MIVNGIIIHVNSGSTANAWILILNLKSQVANVYTFFCVCVCMDAQITVSYSEEDPKTRAGSQGSINGTTNMNNGVCTLSEQFTSYALYYVTLNRTEFRIIQALQQAKGHSHPLNEHASLSYQISYYKIADNEI